MRRRRIIMPVMRQTASAAVVEGADDVAAGEDDEWS